MDGGAVRRPDARGRGIADNCNNVIDYARRRAPAAVSLLRLPRFL